MIRLYREDNAGYNDFQNNLFSINICKFNFVAGTISVNNITYSMGKITDLTDCSCQQSANSNSGSAVNKETFIATANQRVFTTIMTLNDNASVFVEGALQNASLYNRSVNTITFVAPLDEGLEVVILN